MKRSALLLAVLSLVAGTVTAQSVAFTDVTVIDVAEGVAVPGMTVVVTGDRITGVGTGSRGTPVHSLRHSYGTKMAASRSSTSPGSWVRACR